MKKDKIERKYLKIGDKYYGEIVTMVYGESPLARVYATKTSPVNWEYFAEKALMSQSKKDAVAHFTNLYSRASRFVSKKQIGRVRAHLGAALYASLSYNGDEVPDTFKDVEANIESEVKQIRFYYLAGASIAGMTVLIITAIFYSWVFETHWRLVLIGCMGGSFGALISVLQRSGGVDIDSDEKNYLILQGVARTILGILFGIFIVFAIKANLVLGTFKENNMAVFVFAVVAGFSERFVPEILKQLESKGTKGFGKSKNHK